MRSPIAVAGAVVLLPCVPAAAFPGGAPAGSFQLLGRLPGGSQPFSGAYGISADGSVVVGQTSSTPGYQGFRWTAGAGMIGYGDLIGSVYESNNRACSADGSVVVGYANNTQGQQAVRWTGTGPNFGVTLLGDLPGGGIASEAHGVSSDGNTIVGQSSSTTGYQAFRWRNGTMSPLGYLGQDSGGYFYSYGEGCSGDGQTVIGGSSSAPGFQAFRWTSAGGMVGLGDLPGGDFTSYAGAISRDGSTIVGYGTTERGLEACVWRNGALTALPGQPDPLPGMQLDNTASAVSADGSVVVGFARGLGAFVWTPDQGMRSLQSVLVDTFGLDLHTVTITDALAISDDGRTIAGLAWNQLAPGQPGYEAFVAVIPNPGAGLLMALGSLALLRRNRRPSR